MLPLCDNFVVLSTFGVGVSLFQRCLFMPADAPATTSASSSSSEVCPQCGTNKKNGKRSCCASGGSWFNKCGDVGDSTFEHTWGEGLQACNSVESPHAMLLSRKEAATHPLNTSSTALQRPTDQHANIFHPVGVSDAVHSADYLSVAKIFACATTFCFPIIWGLVR